MINKLRKFLGIADNSSDPAYANMPSDASVESAMAGILLRDLIKERRSDRRWLWVKRLGMAMFFLIGVGLYLKSDLLGIGFGPSQKSIGVVRIEGEISRDGSASAEKLVRVLEKAFVSSKVKAVVLAIDSPGGAPLEAERISFVIERLRQEHEKPVYAVIQNVGASAAYMIAVQADKVYAGRYSIVGSIGAVLASWDVHAALERLHVEQKVYASGELKAMLNPFVPTTPEAEAKAQELVDAVGRRFMADVQKRRTGKLQAGIAYDTGEIWDGETAMKIGLIDAVGTIESVAAEFDAKVHEFSPTRPGRHLLGFSLGEWVSEQVRAGSRAVMGEAAAGLR